jgi:hypothetical protein
MRFAIFATENAARIARARIDEAEGFPRPGTNAVTGALTPPGAPGWTLTHSEIVRVTDADGAFFPPGATRFIVGPIDDDLAIRIAALPSPPTMADVPLAILRRGRRWAARIGAWVDGTPVLAEDVVDWDDDASPIPSIAAAAIAARGAHG